MAFSAFSLFRGIFSETSDNITFNVADFFWLWEWFPEVFQNHLINFFRRNPHSFRFDTLSRGCILIHSRVIAAFSRFKFAFILASSISFLRAGNSGAAGCIISVARRFHDLSVHCVPSLTESFQGMALSFATKTDLITFSAISLVPIVFILSSQSEYQEACF